MLLVAAGLWGSAGLIARGAPMGGTVLALWRSLLGAVVYQTILVVRGRRPRLADLRHSALGGAGFGLSIAFLFVAFKTTTLVSANVIGVLQPIVLGIAVHRRGQVISRPMWTATLVAVVGTVVVVAGSAAGGGAWSLRGDLFALAGMLANVVYVVGTKRARVHLGAMEYQASMLWVAFAVILPVALLGSGGDVLPPAKGVWWVAGIVAVGGTGHVLFSAAQHHVSVAASSSILLAEVLASAIGAAIVFDQPIRPLQALGMVIVAVGVGAWVRRTGADAALVPSPLPDVGLPDGLPSRPRPEAPGG